MAKEFVVGTEFKVGLLGGQPTKRIHTYATVPVDMYDRHKEKALSLVQLVGTMTDDNGVAYDICLSSMALIIRRKDNRHEACVDLRHLVSAMAFDLQERAEDIDKG
jgi:hypothetical protein